MKSTPTNRQKGTRYATLSLVLVFGLVLLRSALKQDWANVVYCMVIGIVLIFIFPMLNKRSDQETVLINYIEDGTLKGGRELGNWFLLDARAHNKIWVHDLSAQEREQWVQQADEICEAKKKSAKPQPN